MLVTCPFHAIFVRRGEDFFGRHIGNAVAPVPRRGAAAQPQMIVGKTDAEIGAGSAEVQRRIALLVQPVGARHAGLRRAFSTRPRDRAGPRATRRKWRPKAGPALRPAADRGILPRPTRE